MIALACLPSAARAQLPVWPAKPPRILVASAAGATTDTVARGLTDPLSKQLGQSVIVDNRVGADGIIGTAACAKAPPDGYMLCATASNVMIWNMVLRADLPYHSVHDFVPVMHAKFFDSTLSAHDSRPYNTVQQLIDYSKANPAKVNWGHFGANSTGFMIWIGSIHPRARPSTRRPTRHSRKTSWRWSPMRCLVYSVKPKRCLKESAVPNR